LSGSDTITRMAWDICEQFVAEWKETPFLWERERDLQAELYARLTSSLRVQGRLILPGFYDRAPAGYERRQYWSRVGCEPRVAYTIGPAGTATAYCYPDLVIWDQLRDSESPPPSEYWPVLWACEIKMGGAQSGKTWDLEKLRLLIGTGRVKHGCALHFRREVDHHITTGPQLWRRDELEGKLWLASPHLSAQSAI
jgi:hypothetical protein